MKTARRLIVWRVKAWALTWPPKAPLPTGAPRTGLRCALRGVPRPGVSPVNATALIRGMFHKISDKPQPGMGVFPSEWLESTFMPAAVRKVTNSRSLQDFSLQYGEPLGDAHLRRLLAKKLSTLNVHTVPEHIITTVGATHALDDREPHAAAPWRPGDGGGARLGGGVCAAGGLGHAHPARAASR